MREYLQILIFTMLFVVVVEMVFPDSDLKKYIKLILACVVIYTLFSPILKLEIFNAGGLYEEYVSHYDEVLGLNNNRTGAYYLEEYEELFLEAYKEQEVERIKEVVESEFEVVAKQVVVEIDDSQYVPEVKSIDLVIGNSYEEVEEEGEIARIYIPKIKIGDKSENYEIDSDNLKKDIKNCLGNFYNWDKVNIHIIVQDD